MSQFTFGNIDETTTDGFVLATMLEAFEAAINTDHAGVTEPSYKVTGIVWRDTSGSPHIVKKWDGSQWIVLGTFNVSTHVWTPYFAGNPITALATKAIGEGLEDDAGNLRIKLDGSSLSRSAAGIKLPNTGVTPGIYDAANITVDAFGRITSAEDGGGQGWQLIDFRDVSGSPSELSFEDVFVDDWSYMLELGDLRNSSNGPDLRLRFAASADTWYTSTYAYNVNNFLTTHSSVSTSFMYLAPEGFRANWYISGNIWLPNPRSSNSYAGYSSLIRYRESGSALPRIGLGMGELIQLTPMSSVQLSLSAGSFVSGRLSLYGCPNA